MRWRGCPTFGVQFSFVKIFRRPLDFFRKKIVIVLTYFENYVAILFTMNDSDELQDVGQCYLLLDVYLFLEMKSHVRHQ